MIAHSTASLTSPPATRRRFLLGLAGLSAALPLVGELPQSRPRRRPRSPRSAQKIADHFSSSPHHDRRFRAVRPAWRTDRRQVLHRSDPGKLRFNYEAPSGYRVISDGQSVVIDNSKLNTMDLYPLSKTPLKLLLDDRIDLSGRRVTGVKEETDLTTIQLADKSVFGNSTITHDVRCQDLRSRQWTITDAQGKDTTVMIFNVQQGVRSTPSCSRSTTTAQPAEVRPAQLQAWHERSQRWQSPRACGLHAVFHRHLEHQFRAAALAARRAAAQGARPMCCACRKPSARTSCFRSSSFKRLGYRAHRHQRPEGLSRRRHDLAACRWRSSSGGGSATWTTAGICRHQDRGRRPLLLIHNFYVPAGGDEPDPEINREIPPQARISSPR